MATPYPKLASDRIKSTLLINKLQNHVLDGSNHPMTRTQVAAAIALIKKTVPDLQSIDATVRGANGGPVLVSIPGMPGDVPANAETG